MIHHTVQNFPLLKFLQFHTEAATENSKTGFHTLGSHTLVSSSKNIAWLWQSKQPKRHLSEATDKSHHLQHTFTITLHKWYNLQFSRIRWYISWKLCKTEAAAPDYSTVTCTSLRADAGWVTSLYYLSIVRTALWNSLLAANLSHFWEWERDRRNKDRHHFDILFCCYPTCSCFSVPI